MILIADSGSTKCDWALLDDNGVKKGETSSKGMNPFFFTSKAVVKELRSIAALNTISNAVVKVFFYGSGCSTPELQKVISTGLEEVFPNADVIVDHDLVGAAYSVYDGRPAITAILGTGSNSCYFDGKVLEDKIHNLAYILGDESSGNYYGKILLRQYFYNQLPEEIAAAFTKEFNLSKDELLKNVYQNQYANTWLAGFMRFIHGFKSHPHVKNWIVSGMNEFIDIHVKGYDCYGDVPMHCIGSIGYYFKDVLEEVTAQNGITLGNVIKKPLDGLVDYHLTYMKQEIFG